MATKPLHGQHHRAHHHGHAHHGNHAHQGQKAHKSGEKPTLADKPAPAPQAPQAPQVAQGAPPQAAAAAPPPPQQPALKDKFTPPTAAPVNLAPGATGERKAPPSLNAAAPTPKTKPTISEATHLDWIGQLAPTGAPTDYNGLMYCGPAAGAMIAREIGYEPQPNCSDASLVQNLAQFGQTDPITGTTGNGMINMYQEMGLETSASRGADMTWINDQLAAGRYVTALGDYYQVPGRIDADKTAGHYLDVTGYKEATPHKEARYVVSDPAAEDLKWMTASQLQTFISSAPQGGFAISAWAAAAADPTVV